MPGSGHSQLRAASMWIIFIVVNTCLVACASRWQPPVAEPPQALNIKTLLVLPFKGPTEPDDVGATIRCPTCGTVFVTGPITPGIARYMTEQLLTFLRTKTTYTLLPPGTAEGVRSKILAESVGLSDRDLVHEMGRKLEVDAVISGTVYRFTQRVGTRFSVDSPASVAFGIHLIRVADGRLVWVGHADETQQPLSENLFKLSSFVKRGGTWLTAEDLARLELERVMASFPIP